MKEYIKIPTYTNAARTQFYKYLYIVVLSNATIAAVNSARRTFQIGDSQVSTGITFSTSGTTLGSLSQTSTLNRYCKQSQVDAALSYINTQIASLINPAFSMAIRDKFSLDTFFDGFNSGDIYIKNGGFMRVSDTNVWSGTALQNTHTKLIDVYTSQNVKSTSFRLERYADPGYDVNLLSAGSYVGFSARNSVTKQVAKNVASAHSPWMCSYSPGTHIFISPESYNVRDYPILGRFNTVVSGLYYNNTTTSDFPPSEYRDSQMLGDYTEGKDALRVLLGYTTNISTFTDAEVVQLQEDDDNSYPGGGEDKNEYPEDGESGKGDFDNTNDPIEFPTLPTFDVQSTGFISLWRPTITQLTDLYAFLWDSDIATTLKKLFNEPMNAIFSLGIIPVDPVIQGTRHLTIGHVDTEIDMESIQKQFVTFDFGSIDITEYYGAAWDYSPYTHASIYLPYIGVQPVDIDDIMNCTLTLRYNIDVLTGTTIALLKCVRKGRDNLNAVMYEWQGNCVTQCPITAGNWSQIMASVIQLGAMTGLALSQPVVGAIGSAVGSSAAAEYAQGKNLVNPTMATYGALNVLGSKVHVQRGGRLDMSSGAMSMQKAFVILNRPVSGIPRGWNKYAGYPSLKIKTLGSQEGFVSVGAIKLDGLRATADEINELDTILKTGVII